MESFNGESIRYKAGTPISSIPSTGERIYYDEFTTVFPYGLCAEVVSLTSSGSRMVHNVKELAPDELFNGYFHAGEGIIWPGVTTVQMFYVDLIS